MTDQKDVVTGRRRWTDIPFTPGESDLLTDSPEIQASQYQDAATFIDNRNKALHGPSRAANFQPEPHEQNSLGQYPDETAHSDPAITRAGTCVHCGAELRVETPAPEWTRLVDAYTGLSHMCPRGTVPLAHTNGC